ncbi:MAG: cell envelope integrity protein CreD [Cyclobacteriaceae bacterium]
MDTQNTPTNLLDRFNNWLQESITIKLLSIGFLLLMLLIPLSWIDDLIQERQFRSEEVLMDITSKWSGRQTISGPIVVLPYKYREVVKEKGEEPRIVEHVRHAFFSPDDLNVGGKVEPQVLHRGIYEAAVYESALTVNAKWKKEEAIALKIDGEVLWNEAYLIFGISDLRGISDNPTIMNGGQKLESEPSNNLGVNYRNESLTGLVAKLNWTDYSNFDVPISLQLKFKGSRGLDFIPVGKTTNVSLEGPWANPSFNGEFLPDSRTITEQGFQSHWNVLHYNRPFAQAWLGARDLSGYDFGVDLLIPVEQYQKSMRTSKYGHLVILLSFISLFLVEISQKIKIHPFQYILTGAGLIIYYTMLLSFSEQIGYNSAYLVSSLATVGLLTLYSQTFLKPTKLVVLFSSLLTVFYSFIFVIIIQQDFSLLIGSIGLFIVVGAMMYLTRKINWYKNATVG